MKQIDLFKLIDVSKKQTQSFLLQVQKYWLLKSLIKDYKKRETPVKLLEHQFITRYSTLSEDLKSQILSIIKENVDAIKQSRPII